MRNQPRLLRRQLPQILVHQRRRLLQNPKRPNQLRGHGVFANRKVHQRPRRLRPVIPVRRHLHLPHAVRFRARRPVRRCRPVPRYGMIRRGPPNLSHNSLHYCHTKSYSNPPPPAAPLQPPSSTSSELSLQPPSRWFTLSLEGPAYLKDTTSRHLLLIKHKTCATVARVTSTEPRKSFASYHIPASPALSWGCTLFCATAAKYPSHFQ